MIWLHIRSELSDAAYHLRCAVKATMAAVFGRFTHDGYAVPFRGTSYRIKLILKTE